MSVYLYDKSVVADLRNRLGDSRISIVPPEDFMSFVSQIDIDNPDRAKFPAISIERPSWSLSDSKPQYMKTSGILAEKTIVDNNIHNNVYIRLQAMPIKISYQLDIWSVTREEDDNILRELIFYYRLHPTLKVTIPYQFTEPIQMNFNIEFGDTVDDNSDIVNHKNYGRLFRQTIPLFINDAYLFKTTKSGPTTIGSINVDVVNGSNEERA
jgi:hypothetical protein